MSYSFTTHRGEVSASIPSMVIAGQPIVVIVGSSGQDRSSVGSAQFHLRYEKPDAVVWGTDREAELDQWPAREVQGFAERTTFGRVYTIRTLPNWAGTLLLRITTPALQAPLTSAIMLVDQAEIDEVANAVRALTGRDTRTGPLPTPMAGDERFHVSDVMRGVGSAAEVASTYLGPLVRVIVRSHQESLAVMGGFEPRPPQDLLGSVAVLEADMSAIFESIRRRISTPASFRLAHQVIVRQGVLGGASGPVIFMELSVPAEPPVDMDEARVGVLAELAQLTNPTAWSFEGGYEEKRLRIYARVGPFARVRRVGQGEPVL